MCLLFLLFVGGEWLTQIWVQIVNGKLTVERPLAINGRLAAGDWLNVGRQLFHVLGGQLAIGSRRNPIKLSRLTVKFDGRWRRRLTAVKQTADSNVCRISFFIFDQMILLTASTVAAYFPVIQVRFTMFSATWSQSVFRDPLKSYCDLFKSCYNLKSRDLNISFHHKRTFE